MTKNNKQTVLVRANKRRDEVDLVVRRPRGQINKRKVQKQQNVGFRITERISAPIAAGSITGMPRPMIKTREDSVIVVNSEVFNTLNQTLAAVLSFNQAVIPAALTWLNGVAQNFQKYRWLSFRMIYIPNCSTSSTGGVTFSTQYDTADSPPTTRLQASALYNSVSCPYWAGWEGAELLSNHTRKPVPGSIVVELDVSRVGKPWYPYFTAVNYAAQTGVDRNLYAPAFMTGVTDGGTLGISGGTVYAQYCIELIEPVTVALNQ